MVDFIDLSKQSEFRKAAEPLMKYLTTLHPHHTAIVTSTNAELLEGQRSHNTTEFLKD